MKLFAHALAACVLLGSPAFAETYVIDPVHTQVLFFVDHLGFTKSAGRLHVQEGTFDYDAKNPATSAVNVKIDASSLDMGNERWNTHMKSKDFFNVEQHPTIEFVSRRVEAKDTDNLIVHGDLTMLGVTKPVALKVKVNKVGAHPMNKKPYAGFSGVTKLKRSDFGMNYGLPAIGDEAEIRLEVEGSSGRSE